MIYKGKCIGGIADGREFQHHKPEMVVKQRKKNPDGQDYETGVQTEYKYLLLLGSVNFELGVWVPVGVSVEQVVRRMIKVYNPAARRLIH